MYINILICIYGFMLSENFSEMLLNSNIVDWHHNVEIFRVISLSIVNFCFVLFQRCTIDKYYLIITLSILFGSIASKSSRYRHCSFHKTYKHHCGHRGLILT